LQPESAFDGLLGCEEKRHGCQKQFAQMFDLPEGGNADHGGD
jgi:hypothetical protein